MKEVRRAFGKNYSVSLFTLGTMRALKSPEAMYLVVKAALEIGINHLETAPLYGPAESYLGKAIKKLAREGLQPNGGWIITTKILPGVGLQEGKLQIKNMLSRLGVSKLENLAIHGLNLTDHLEWSINGAGSELLKWAKGENLVEQFGFSSHGSTSLITEALESDLFDFCSLHLHLLDQERLPIAQKALEKGIGVMAISPADKGGQLQNPSLTLIDDCKPIPPLELAYRFLLANGISTLTVGAADPKDLEIVRKLVNSDKALTEIERNAIKTMQKKRIDRLGASYCGQCRACIPCPNSVPIPEILRLRNLSLGHDLINFGKERYNLIGKAGHWWEQVNATACKECGECLPRCPNKLPIPKLLLDTHNLLRERDGKRLWG